LSVRVVGGKTTTLDVEPTETIKTIKDEYYDKVNLYMGSNRLIFAGKHLEEIK
jgi:hypothetical protein